MVTVFSWHTCLIKDSIELSVISPASAQSPMVYNESSSPFVFGSSGSLAAQSLAQLFDIDGSVYVIKFASICE